jgi:hypothetical protein
MDYRYILIFLILPQLATPIFADCVGYNDSFDARVLDANYRPMAGANVTVKYDRGQTFGEQYFTTPPKQTNAQGIVHFDIYNGGTTSRTIDCDIVVSGSVSDFTKSTTVIANQHGPVVDVVLDEVFPLRFYVRDQLKAPLADATVTVGSKGGRTDQNGLWKEYFNKGTYDYFASYLDASQPGTLDVTNDTDFEVVFTYYKVSIDITDDKGDPLDATITIFNTTFTMEDGHFENARVFGESVPYNISYQGVVKSDVIMPAANPIITLRYDITSPLVGSITPDIVANTYKLNIDASDPNQYASGLDISSIKVYYKLEPSDATTPWSNALVFTSGRNRFTADFPALPENSIVKFRVEVKDKAGNRAEKEGQFSTYAAPPPQNGTDNQTTPQPDGQPEQGIPLLYIIGGAIILILGLYLVFRTKSKPAGGS